MPSRKARIHDIFHQEDMLAGDVLRKVGDHLYLPRALGFSSIAGDDEEVHAERNPDRAGQVGIEGVGTFQHTDQDQVLVQIVGGDLPAQFSDACTHFLLGDKGSAKDLFHVRPPSFPMNCFLAALRPAPFGSLAWGEIGGLPETRPPTSAYV